MDAADENHVDGPPVRRGRRILTIVAIVTVAVAVPLVALWAFRAATRGASLGATCSNGRQCESGECLSPHAYEENPLDDGSPMMRARKSSPDGACTQPCRDATECPEAMTCADVLQDIGARKPYATRRCMPAAWQ